MGKAAGLSHSRPAPHRRGRVWSGDYEQDSSSIQHIISLNEVDDQLSWQFSHIPGTVSAQFSSISSLV